MARWDSCDPDDLKLVLGEMRSAGISPSVGDWTTLLAILARTGRIPQMQLTLHQLVAQSIITREEHVERLLRTLVHLKKPSGVAAVVGSLALSGIAITGVSAQALIEVHAKLGDVNNALAYFDMLRSRSDVPPPKVRRPRSGEQAGPSNSDPQQHRAIAAALSQIVPDARIIDSTIEAACAASRIDVAVSLYNRMIMRGIKPTLWTYSHLLRALGRARDPVTAAVVWDRMRFMGIEPDLKLYTMYIKLHADCGDISNMVAYFVEARSRGIKPDCWMFNALLHGYGVVRNVRAMHSVYENMVTTMRIVPDETTFTLLMDAHATAGDTQGAHRWFEIMCGDMSVPIPPVPDPAEQLGLTASHAGDNNSVPAVFARRTERGAVLPITAIKPGVIPFTVLLSANARAGNTEAVLRIVRDMQDRGVALNLHAYTAVLHAFATAGDMARAVETYNAMLSGPRPVMPDHAVFDTLIGGFVTRGEFGTAWEWMETMERRDIAPTANTFTIFIDAHIKAGDVDQAYEVFEKMVKRQIDPSEHALTTLIVHLTRERFVPVEPESDHETLRRANQVWEAARWRGKVKVEARAPLTSRDPAADPVDDDDSPRWRLVPDPGDGEQSPFLDETPPMPPSARSHEKIIRVYKRYRALHTKTRRPLKIYDALISHLIYFDRVYAARDIFVDMIHHGCIPDQSVMLRMVRAQAFKDGWPSVNRWFYSVLHIMDSLSQELTVPLSLSPSRAMSLTTIRENGMIDASAIDQQRFPDARLVRTRGEQTRLVLGSRPMRIWRDPAVREQFERDLTAVVAASYGRFAFLPEWRDALGGDSLGPQAEAAQGGDPLFARINTMHFDSRSKRFVLVGSITSEAAMQQYWHSVIETHARFGDPIKIHALAAEVLSRVNMFVFSDVLSSQTTLSNDGLQSVLHGKSKVDGFEWIDMALEPLQPFTLFFRTFVRYCELAGFWKARRMAIEWLFERAGGRGAAREQGRAQ
nr:hypothetical protein HK105_000517 [Polyrhizophydium stewartii]